MPHQSLHRSARLETISLSDSSRLRSPDDDHHPAYTSSGASVRREARTHREARISMAKTEVEDLRSQVTRCRLELRELRVVLRQGQVKICQMQAQFWRGLQNQWNDARTFDKTPLQQLDDEIERALDELGPEQANYDEKEDDLYLLEYNLGKLEDRFYTTDKAGFASFSSSSSSRRSRSITPTRPEDEASWNYLYLSRVGDAKIVRERLEDLNLEKSQYVDLERHRTAMGLDLYMPNVEFLESYKDDYAKTELELREIEEDLNRLRKEWPSTPLTLAKPFETTDLPQHSASLPHEREGPKPSHRDTLRRKSDGDLQNVPMDTLTNGQRVNQWILKSLTGSALERARHRAMLHNPNLDDDTWKSLVMDYWQPDQAAVSPPLSRRRGSKSPSSVSAQLKAFSHGTQCASKLKEENVKADAVDHQRDMSSLVWGTESQLPSKTSAHEHFVYEEESSPRSPYKMKDYFNRDRDRDECKIYSTSPSNTD